MNVTTLVGRFTKDPEVRYTDGGTSIARFTLAVDRRFKKEDGPQADFISCVAFGKTAEFIEKYFRKGQKMGLTGRIQTGSYTDKDNVKRYTTDVIAEAVEFVDSKGNESATTKQQNDSGFQQDASDGFMNIPDGLDEELPFA